MTQADGHRTGLSEIRALEAERARDEALAMLSAMRASSSWRLTAPLRAIGHLRRGKLGAAASEIGLAHDRAAHLPAASAPEARASDRAEAAARGARQGQMRAVHQFHAGSAMGDAITNAMLLTQGLLRQLGYRSEIFVAHRDPALADRLLELDDMPEGDDYVLIVRHSMGHEALPAVMSLPAPKVLIYHNITPPEFLEDAPSLAAHAALGQKQTPLMRPLVGAALADSDYNALELRRMGYANAAACPLLFDIDALRARAEGDASRSVEEPFTLLFVGRITASKGQADLVDAFAAFKRLSSRPCRMALVGRVTAANEPYAAKIKQRIDEHGLSSEVLLTGAVSDAELDAWYRRADAYVSLSLHEGFGVPLVEAMAYGVPVIAWPCGAVPYTLGGAAILLADRRPETVAFAVMRLAQAADYRAEIAARQKTSLERFALQRHVPTLLQALATAGATVQPDARAREAEAANLRITLIGPIGGASPEGATIRALALALEAKRPGLQHILAEGSGEATPADLGVPPEERLIAEILARPPAPTRPQAFVSPPGSASTGDPALGVRMVLWAGDEPPQSSAAIERLAGSCDTVLVSTEAMARSLTDQGLPLPVRILGERLAPESLADRIVETALTVSARPRVPARIAWITLRGEETGLAAQTCRLTARLAVSQPQLCEPPLILGDATSQGFGSADGGRILPALWRAGPEPMPALARQVSVCDPDAVIVEPDFERYDLAELAKLLGDRRLRNRIRIVVLHHGRLPAGSANRDVARGALGDVSRIVVPGSDDLTMLAAAGLSWNVTVLKEDAPTGAEGMAQRLVGMAIGLAASRPFGALRASGAIS